MAMDSLSTGLMEEGHQVQVITLHTQKHPFREHEMDADYLEETSFQAVFADTELNIRDAISHIVTGESYHLSRFHVPDMERTIEDILRVQVFDVVILESLFTTSYIPAIRRLSDAELVLRAHNVEHQLWEEVSDGMPAGPKKWLLNLFQSKLREEEIRLLGVVDAIAAITDNDALWFEQAMESGDRQSRVISLPFGLDVEGRPHHNMNQAPDHALHLGSMDWTPNVQGVMWLKDEVWPMVNKALEGARLELAGRHMPDGWVSEPDRGIVVLGEVENAADTYNTSCVVVVPVHAGSGMRIKMAEALAAGRPIVTTTKGMEGLALQSGIHVLVADTNEDMAEAIVKVLTDPQLALSLGKAGREWAVEHLSHRARARELTQHLTTWVQA